MTKDGQASAAKAMEKHLVGAAGARPPRCWFDRLRALLRCDDGSPALEFALSAPILVGLLVPVADLGIAFSRQIQVQQAAQAGAHYAAAHPWYSNAAADIARAVTSATTLPVAANPTPRQMCACANGTTLNEVTCGATCTNSEIAGYFVVVNAQLPYTPALPYSVLGNSVTLTAQTTVRIR